MVAKKCTLGGTQIVDFAYSPAERMLMVLMAKVARSVGIKNTGLCHTADFKGI